MSGKKYRKKNCMEDSPPPGSARLEYNLGQGSRGHKIHNKTIQNINTTASMHRATRYCKQVNARLNEIIKH